MGGKENGIVERIARKYGNDKYRLMDVVQDVQEEKGSITEDTIAAIADALSMRRVEVRDMVSFYAFLSREKKGTAIIRLCDAVVERMKGADEVAEAFEEALGIPFGQTTPDGKITLEHTACIGMSDQAPSALINEIPVVNLKPSDVPKIVKALRAGKDPSELPQSKVALNLLKSGPVIFSPFENGAGIRATVARSPEKVIDEIKNSRLRGRGGAGFPAGAKLDFCRKAKGEIKYVICNADEGEPGTFKDRVILTLAPDLVFEGMTIAGYAISAKMGLLYLRGEYAYLKRSLEDVLAERRASGLLGKNIGGCKGFDFDIRIQLGAGAYVCGEESALIESLEGKRGAPRDRPPFPVQKGFMDEPSVVSNVETLCCVSRIMEKGAEWFAKMGTKDSTGTKLLSISGDCERPGVYEVEYGITVTQMLDMVGVKKVQAVQIGGPSGRCVAPKDFGRKIAFEDLPTGGSVIIFNSDRDLLEQMRRFMEFFVHESCGWCVPCRVGTSVLLREFERVLKGKASKSDLKSIANVCETVKLTSRCGLGQTAPNPILTTISDFPHLYSAVVKSDGYIPRLDLAKALEEGCAATGRKINVEEHE